MCLKWHTLLLLYPMFRDDFYLRMWSPWHGI